MLSRSSRRAATQARLPRGRAPVLARGLFSLLANRRSVDVDGVGQAIEQIRSLHLSQAPARDTELRKTRQLEGARKVSQLRKLEEPEGSEGSKEPQKPKPFTELNGLVHRDIYQALIGKPFHFTEMSLVQKAVLELLPDIADPIGAPRRSEESLVNPGSDLLVKAKTGTGKTIAFLTPALEARLRDIENEKKRFQEQNLAATPQDLRRHIAKYRLETTGVLILSPTRELATQIAREATRLCSGLKNVGVCLFVGGAGKGEQLRNWNYGERDIVVATPGRMADVLESFQDIATNLRQVKTLIFDEADTLLELGFKEKIDEIVSYLRPKEERQTFLFSATIPREVQQVAKRTMKRGFKFIDCVPKGETNVHEHVPQKYTVLPSAADQLPHIFRLLAHDQLLHPGGGKAVVFLPTTRLTELFSQVFIKLKKWMPWGFGTRIHEIHGNRTQRERDTASKTFRAQEDGYGILVTSDVSARGVDYPGVTRVIQVGVPTNRDIYIHRLGRTGRAGKEGRGDIVLLPWEKNFLCTELDGLPIVPYTVEDSKAELAAAAKERDESHYPVPIAVMDTGRPGRSNRWSPQSRAAMQLPVSPRLQDIEEQLEQQVLPTIDDQLIQDAFASSAGFYASKTEALNLNKADLVQGLKTWAVESLGLEKEPYISPAFLKGLGRDRQQNRPGGRREGSRFRDPRPSRGVDEAFSHRDFTRNIVEQATRGRRLRIDSFPKSTRQLSRDDDKAPWQTRGRVKKDYWDREHGEDSSQSDQPYRSRRPLSRREPGERLLNLAKERPQYEGPNLKYEGENELKRLSQEPREYRTRGYGRGM